MALHYGALTCDAFSVRLRFLRNAPDASKTTVIGAVVLCQKSLCQPARPDGVVKNVVRSKLRTLILDLSDSGYLPVD